MLIPLSELQIRKTVKGIIHIGAHECEERQEYFDKLKLNDSNIIWIDAIPEKVEQMKKVYPDATIISACLNDKDNEKKIFHITNNIQSSSLLELKTHLVEHPWVVEILQREVFTKTLNSVILEGKFDMKNYNFLNIDTQGAELLVLKGATNVLPHIDYIYTEVNEKELYQGCVLLPELDEFLTNHGFERVKINMTDHGWGDAFYVRV